MDVRAYGRLWLLQNAEWLIFGARAVTEKPSRWRSRTRYLCFESRRRDLVFASSRPGSRRCHSRPCQRIKEMPRNSYVKYLEPVRPSRLLPNQYYPPKDPRTQLLQVRLNGLTRHVQPTDLHGCWWCTDVSRQGVRAVMSPSVQSLNKKLSVFWYPSSQLVFLLFRKIV